MVVDLGPVRKVSLSDAIGAVARSSAPGQRGALGVITSVRPLDPAFPPAALTSGTADGWELCDDFTELAAAYDRVDVNGLGEGQINVVCEGGQIAIGDLLVTSSTPGKAMRQADDIVRAVTVAKAREAASFDYPGQVKQIACIYLAG